MIWMIRMVSLSYVLSDCSTQLIRMDSIASNDSNDVNSYNWGYTIFCRQRRILYRFGSNLVDGVGNKHDDIFFKFLLNRKCIRCWEKKYLVVGGYRFKRFEWLPPKIFYFLSLATKTLLIWIILGERVENNHGNIFSKFHLNWKCIRRWRQKINCHQWILIRMIWMVASEDVLLFFTSDEFISLSIQTYLTGVH